MIRQHIIEKQWEEDNQFGSITNWFEKIIAEEKESINLVSGFCVLGLRKWTCNSGHIKISTIPIKPFYSINGMEGFDGPFFKENPHLNGQVSALFTNKNEIIFRVHPDEPCPYVRSNLGQCINRKINYEEYIISYPPILIFELTQRDGNSYHSSNQLDFPLHLYCKSSEETLEYMLTARAFSTLP
ncbi:7138_t:CDS:1, partial [Entrophospora sp. SA101]